MGSRQFDSSITSGFETLISLGLICFGAKSSGLAPRLTARGLRIPIGQKRDSARFCAGCTSRHLRRFQSHGRGCCRTRLILTVAQQSSRRHAVWFVIRNRELPIHEYVPVVRSTLDAPPFTARDVMHDLHRRHGEMLVGVHHHVRGHAFLQVPRSRKPAQCAGIPLSFQCASSRVRMPCSRTSDSSVSVR